MEAIGMTRKQLGRMLEMEGLYYALFAVLCSGVLGSIFSLTAVQKIAGGIWFMSYRFIIWPMLVIYPVFLLLGVIVPKAAYRSHKKISLIERIRFSE